MKKLTALFLTFVCIFSLAGCQLNEPAFKDFAEHSQAFVVVRKFLSDYYLTQNNTRLIVDLNDRIFSITENEAEGEAELLKAVNMLKEKGFDYAEIESDYMIFWENETGYYGVLWSPNPRKAIKNIVKNSRPYMKSLKLAKEWYEVGALGSI